MGRTVLPFSRVLEQEVQEWKKFRRGLRKEDQQFLDHLFEEARLHVQAGVYASRPWPFETILVSILIEHEKALVELRSRLKALEEKNSSPPRQIHHNGEEGIWVKVRKPVWSSENGLGFETFKDP